MIKLCVCVYVIYVLLCWVFVAVYELSPVRVSRGCSSLWCPSFLLWLVRSRAQAQCCETGLSCAVAHGIFWTRDQSRVSCVVRWILTRCVTKEVLDTHLKIFFSMIVYHRILNVVPCAVYNRTLLFIHSIYSRIYLLTPDSRSIPFPLYLPLGKHRSVLFVCESVSVS